MTTNPVAAAVALWLTTFPEPVKPGEVIAAALRTPDLLTALDVLMPGFAENPNPLTLSRWLSVMETLSVQTPRGRCRFFRRGHHWEVVVQTPAVAAA